MNIAYIRRRLTLLQSYLRKRLQIEGDIYGGTSAGAYL